MAIPDSPAPCCPVCKHAFDLKRDILFDRTSMVGLAGATFAYCGWCGAVLGPLPMQTFTKKRRG